MTPRKNRPNAIKRRADHLAKKIQHYQKELEALQKRCKHKNYTEQYGANTGNWCPSDDSYWIDKTCKDCGHWWHEDQ